MVTETEARALLAEHPGLFVITARGSGGLTREITRIWKIWSVDTPFSQGYGQPDEAILATDEAWIALRDVEALAPYAPPDAPAPCLACRPPSDYWLG